MELDLIDTLRVHIGLGAVSMGAPEALPGVIERPRDPSRGDVASGLAMRLSKVLKDRPREVAGRLAEIALERKEVESAEVAGPGFVNIRLAPEARCGILGEAIRLGEGFGSSDGLDIAGPVLLEYVSANPTGPLHVGHGRGAAIGDSLARILRFVGCEVRTEYYLNDRGLQTDILAASLWLRVLMERGEIEGGMPEGTYSGDYLVPVARDLAAAMSGIAGGAAAIEGLPDDAETCGAELANRAKAALGDGFERVRRFAVDAMAARIKGELDAFGVGFDSWRSEQDLFDEGGIEGALGELEKKGRVYEKDGAKWFRASAFGDEKDWVVVRSNGELTYFAADIAYHLEKARRGPGLVCDLLGADHHGYVPRLRAALAAFGEDPDRLEAGIIQLVSLANAGDRVRMSKRSGDFVTLGELVGAVGASAARLYFVMSRADVPMTFDVAKALATGPENPVHYMQYAHARSCTLLEKWGGDVGSLAGGVVPAALADADSLAVLTELIWFGETVRTAARERAPHRVAHWLVAMASALHGFYDRVQVLGGAEEGLESRLAVVAATRQALANGMGLLGVDAPNKM